MAFRLQTLLELKKRAEEEAEEAVATAIAKRAKVEKRQEELEQAVVRAREELHVAINAPLEDLSDGGAALARDRFLKRLRANIELRKEEARVHRAGPLAAAIKAEADARAAHIKARQDREALDKFKAKELAKERLVAERRNEDALGDLAIAALVRKQNG
jgi:flagellar biosynthesis chaperone FliJ